MSNIMNITMIPADKLYSHPQNPRTDLGDITELTDSIKVMGILQNLTVVPYNSTDHAGITIADGDGSDCFIIVVGNRRHAAGIKAGVSEFPCAVSSMDLKEQIRTMQVENILREGLTTYQEAKAIQTMLDMGDTVEEMQNNEIQTIFKKYGEPVFRMSLSHLFEVGADRLRNINIEETVNEILASDKNAIITPELQAGILRCACDLARKDMSDILAFVKTDIEFSGVTVHPGIIVDFFGKGTGQKYATYVLPSGTDENLIEDVADDIREALEQSSGCGNVAKLICAKFKEKGIRLQSVGQDMGIEL